jgi:alkanesulfonate monooxygenase SsuD/methylene tetrahydromethanopterin reductase-like flavin-dependent oxidoreductase (luciferase family)
MTRFGYFLSSEEYEPASLVQQAKMTEQAGFEALWISTTSIHGSVPEISPYKVRMPPTAHHDHEDFIFNVSF